MTARGAVVVMDGVLVDASLATISVFDRGLLYGDGCFEVLRTWGGRAIELPAHLDRLRATARFLRMPEPVGIEAAVELALRAAAGEGEGERRIRIVLTHGPGSLTTPMAALRHGRTIVIVEELGPQPEEMSLALVDWPLARRTGTGHKTLAYLDHVIARELARDAGADDAVRLDAEGRVAEGGTCNVFAIARGEFHAPELGVGVLPGIVRGRVLRLCARAPLDLPIRPGPLSLEALFGADEVFATSSLRGVVPVTRMIVHDRERTLPRGSITRRIAAAYLDELTTRSDI